MVIRFLQALVVIFFTCQEIRNGVCDVAPQRRVNHFLVIQLNVQSFQYFRFVHFGSIISEEFLVCSVHFSFYSIQMFCWNINFLTTIPRPQGCYSTSYMTSIVNSQFPRRRLIWVWYVSIVRSFQGFIPLLLCSHVATFLFE